MKWFESGLNKQELKEKYRELTKKYHPDTNPKDGSLITKMQEINAEYDNYVELCIMEFGSTTRKEEKKDHIPIGNFRYFFARWDKNRHGAFFAKDIKWPDYWYYYSTNDCSWDGFKGGICYCEEINHDDLDLSKEIRLIDSEFEFPEFSEIIEWFSSKERYWITARSYRDTFIYHIDTRYGDMVVVSENIKAARDAKILVKRDNKIHVIEIEKKFLGDYTVREEYNISDLLFMEKFNYNTKEFMETFETSWYIRRGIYDYIDCRHDLPFFKDFHHSLRMEPIDSTEVYDPITSFFVRKGIVRIYRSTLKRHIKYGFFDLDNIIKNIHYIDGIEDINEAADYIESINDSAENEIKRMIRKGTIKITI